ncbi:MAG TPA: DUF1206 domain-containing protein [Polyangiaceae bacterium]|nr:DUF1206 domain-containing protein [Polyangiaceae bacterium]
MDTSRDWVEKGARFGHFTKGVIYGLIGALSLQVAIGNGGQVAGQREAVRLVEHQPFGVVLLIGIAIGLLGYAVWRLIEGVKDTSRKGSDGKGMAHRIGAVLSGLINAALAVAVVQVAIGSGGGGGGARSWVGKVLEQPFGAVLLGLVGAGVVVVGVVQFYKAYTKKFLEDFRGNAMSPTVRRWITRAGQVGYSARGVVFPIVGWGLLRAALDNNPGETRDTRGALIEIASSGYGQVLLGLVAVGLLAFGSFMVASARYRAIPT